MKIEYLKGFIAVLMIFIFGFSVGYISNTIADVIITTNIIEDNLINFFDNNSENSTLFIIGENKYMVSKVNETEYYNTLYNYSTVNYSDLGR